MARYRANAREEVDGGFKRTGEESCTAGVRRSQTVGLLGQEGPIPSQKEITDTCTGVVKARRWSASLNDFVSYDIEERPDEFFLCCGNIRPEMVFSFDNLKPLLASLCTLFGQSMVEEELDRSFLALVVVQVIWD